MDKELIDAGYRVYHGTNLDIYFNKARCQHSGNCVRGDKVLFKLDRQPWILPDSVATDAAIRVIKTCPSGALQYRLHNNNQEK